jgi:N-acetylglutamate synthase-like GNAT family acetyltransferase
VLHAPPRGTGDAVTAGEITLRRATRADIPTLDELIAASARGLSAGYYSTEQIEAAIADVFGVDTNLIDDGTYVVACAGDEIVGCGGWSRRRTLFGGDQRTVEREDSVLDPERDAARIRAFFIHPAWARRGIGRAILDACESAAAAEGFSTFELLATLPGEPLYAARGYEPAEPVDVPMSNGLVLPCLRMTKRLG